MSNTIKNRIVFTVLNVCLFIGSLILFSTNIVVYSEFRPSEFIEYLTGTHEFQIDHKTVRLPSGFYIEQEPDEGDNVISYHVKSYSNDILYYKDLSSRFALSTVSRGF